MKLTYLPEHVQQQYNIQALSNNGYVYIEIRRSIYDPPQADKLSKNTYKTNSGHMDIMKWVIPQASGNIYPSQFISIFVDDFGVKHIGENNGRHIIDSLKEEFTISEDWKGGLYRGINLEWDYDKRKLDISMSGNIKKQ